MVRAVAALVLLGSAPAWGQPDVPQVVTPIQPSEVRIDLLEVVISGNSVLPPKTVQTLVEPFLGPGKTLDEVDALRAALEEAYQERGYRTVSVRIPRQVSRSGVVRLEVIENRVGQVTVVGSRYHSPERLKSLAPSLGPGTVPDFDEVQQDLVALNSMPDLRVTPALKPGLLPGTLDVDLAVDDHLPLKVAYEVNNRHSQDTEPLRSQLAVSYANLWQRGHTASFTYQVAPQDTEQSTVFFGSYMARLERSANSVMLSYIESDSNVSTLGGINVLGQGRIIGLRLFAPLAGSDGFFPTVTAGVDYKHFRNVIALPDAGQGAKSFETPVTYYPFSLGLGVLWRATQATTQSDLTLSFASPQMGSDVDENNVARGQQFAARASLGDTRELLWQFQTVTRVAAQATDQPLISTEQFSVGGAESVRGYLESAGLGDQGVAGSVELRSPSLAGRMLFNLAGAFSEMRLFVFADAGQARLREAPPEQDRAFNLASWGAGFRCSLGFLDAVAQWADPLADLPGKPAEPSRLLFRLSGSF